MRVFSFSFIVLDVVVVFVLFDVLFDVLVVVDVVGDMLVVCEYLVVLSRMVMNISS